MTVPNCNTGGSIELDITNPSTAHTMGTECSSKLCTSTACLRYRSAHLAAQTNDLLSSTPSPDASVPLYNA